MRFMKCMIDITRCPLTVILTKTQIILSNMKSYENNKIVCRFDMKYLNSGSGAFLDISESELLGIRRLHVKGGNFLSIIINLLTF